MGVSKNCCRNGRWRGFCDEADARVRSPRLGGVRDLALAVVLAVAVAGCVPDAHRPAAAPPPDVDGLLFGMARCRVSEECSTGVCSMGMCVGFLMVSTDLERARIGGVLSGTGAPLRNDLIEALAGVVGEFETSGVVRARAADALGYLGGDRALRVLSARLDDPIAPVRFFAARSLHRMGDPDGTRVLETFRDHPAEAVRALVAAALDPRTAAGQGDSRK